MKKEVRDLLQVFHQEWASPQGFTEKTRYFSVDTLEDLDHEWIKVNGVLAVKLSYTKTFTNNLVGLQKVTEVVVADTATLVEIIKAIGIAEKTNWYNKWCCETPKYQVGYSWYTKEEILRDHPEYAWRIKA